jgi:hypothetical protein
LVVVYDKGGYGGAKEFAADIRNDWTDEQVLDLSCGIIRTRNDRHGKYQRELTEAQC